jgi:dienelactone hydrolase
MTPMNRRRFCQTVALLSTSPVAGCGAHRGHGALLVCPEPEPELTLQPGLSPAIYAAGPEGAPRVLVLHEMPGLTPDDLALARCLAREGFRVFVPLLFGSHGQNNGLRGFLQACWFGDFECSDRSTRSPVLDTLAPLCDRLAGEGRPLAVVGMCLTGILPLALLPHGVTAAVLCQPSVPFSTVRRKPVDLQKADLGLGPNDLAGATASTVPFLTIHYATDPLCPPERISALRDTFGQRVAVISLDGESKHSSLAADFHPQAFADAVTYLKVRLGMHGGPQPMALAKLTVGSSTTMCEIGVDGRWHPV